MSFGTGADNLSFHDAIRAVYAAGIVQVAAAGNNGPGSNTVQYPAKYSETIAVSAVDSANQIASWSSRGPEIDLTAPGVEINSTWNNGYYNVISGTSMAAPHITAVAGMVLSAKGPMSPDVIE